MLLRWIAVLFPLPAPRKNPSLVRIVPNLLTGLRLLSAPVLVWLIVGHRLNAAIGVVIFAALTDWFDGYAARRLGVIGTTGLILDPMADKLMLVALFCALTYSGYIPWWFLALALGRDVVVVGGALLVRLRRNVRKFPPKVLGKVSTFFQIVYALLCLLWAAFPFELLLWLERTALTLATLFTVLSGVDYVRVGIRIAKEPRRSDNSVAQIDGAQKSGVA